MLSVQFISQDFVVDLQQQDVRADFLYISSLDFADANCHCEALVSAVPVAELSATCYFSWLSNQRRNAGKKCLLVFYKF